MKPAHANVPVLLRYFDGGLAPADAAQLNRLLTEDPATRAWFREVAEQAVGLGDIERREAWIAGTDRVLGVVGGGGYAGKEAGCGSRRPGRREAGVAGRGSRGWQLRAAAVALLTLGALGAAWWVRTSDTTVASVIAVNGSVVWQPSANNRGPIETGMKLGAGTLVSEGEGSAAEVRYKDGSKLRLAGNTEIAIVEDRGSKLVLLRQGVLTATVAGQPAGRPLRVRTATAEIEVLGTVFTVGARGEATRVEVGFGKVRVRRLVDGREVEVTAHRATLASLDPAEALIAEARPPARRSWGQRFDVPLIEGWRGAWRPAADDAPACWGARPYLAGRRSDGTPIMHRGLVGRAAPGAPGQRFAAVAPDSVLALRYRTATPCKLMVFISVHELDGAFGGNFETLIPSVPDSEDEGGGWRKVEIPLADLKASSPGHPRLLDGREVFLFLISTRETDAGLEVAEIGIHPAASTAPPPL